MELLSHLNQTPFNSAINNLTYTSNFNPSLLSTANLNSNFQHPAFQSYLINSNSSFDNIVNSNKLASLKNNDLSNLRS